MIILSRKVIEAKEPRCGYCLHGKLSADGNSVLCPKKGVMDKDSFCKKFRYDPLKRVPKIANPAAGFDFSPEDFEL